MTDTKIRKYQVDPDAFFRRFPPKNERVPQAMSQLIAAYGLRDLDVASLGPREAEEELHFLKAGCTVDLFELDEMLHIEPVLLACRTDRDTGMTYYIGDFFDVNVAQYRERYDVIYLSSFGPDEVRRGELLKEIQPDTGEANRLAWYDKKPFHQTMVAAVTTLLRPGGLLIVQSYYAGVDYRLHPGYLPACNRQLSEVGLRLLDVYAYREAVGIKLFVARKGRESVQRAELTMFHGRAKLDEPIDPIFRA